MTALTKRERTELLECECNIEIGMRNGFEAYVMIGDELKRIRDGKLYRDGYGTFDEYVEQRWEMSRTAAYRMIDAATTFKILSPMGDKTPVAAEICTFNERRIRELTGISKGKLHEILQEIERQAADGRFKPTAKAIAEVKAKVLGSAKPEPELLEAEEDQETPPMTGELLDAACGEAEPTAAASRGKKPPAKPRHGAITGVELAKQLSLRAVGLCGQVVRLTDEIADAIGDRGPNYLRCASAQNVMLPALKDMGDGKP